MCDNDGMITDRKRRYNDGWPWWMRSLGHVRRRVVALTGGSALILLYHRVADLTNDPEQLAISPVQFEEQIAAFSKEFNLASLSEVVKRLQNGQRLDKKTLCISFDDGYKDNFTCALPILERYKAPATFFIAGDGLDSDHHYPWEQHAPELYEHANSELLAQASRNPLVEIGGHTQTHPRLSLLSREEQLFEIAENKTLLEDITGKKLQLFAYPFGQMNDFDDSSVAAVAACGYQAAVTTSSGLVSKGVDLFCLPREDVSSLDATEAIAYLRHAFGD